MKKEGNGVQEPLYKELKTRGILSHLNIEENPDCWIKAPPLDAKSVTPPKLLNEVSQVPKH